MLNNTLRQLRLAFVVSVTVAIVTFAADVFYSLKYVSPVENAVLERWVIIITLFGVFGALKFLHPKLKKNEKTNRAEALKKYSLKYYIRLFVLIAVYVLNLCCLHFTGVKNFIFLGIIVIFAMLFCAPNKDNIESETQADNDEPQM